MKNRPWLQILIVGALLFFAAEYTLVSTGNLNFVPTILLLGSFLIPVVFVTYFYDHVQHREISLPLLTTCFVVGGVLGAVAGGILEYSALRNAGVFTMFGVGFIEEAAKLIFPVIVYLGWRYKHEADGLLFGVAAGMGFASIETMGYGMVFLIESGGDVAGLQQLLAIRGFLSPAEHAAWTGFVCAVIWREREHGHGVMIGWPVIGAFFLVVLLHSLWNIVNSIPARSPAVFNALVLANATLVIISLSLLFYRYRNARKSLANAQ